jgi:DNA-binding XRE family transcriptional regulator
VSEDSAPAKRGPNDKYDPDLHPRLAEAIAKFGATDAQIAVELGVSRSTISQMARNVS